MNDFGVIPVLLELAALLMAHLVLRTVSSMIRQYATSEGTPRLGMSLRLIGLLVGIAVAPIVLLPMVIFAFEPMRVESWVFAVSSLVVAAYLLAVGAHLFWTGSKLQEPGDLRGAENGAWFSYALSEGALVLAWGVCGASYFVPLAVFVCAPAIMIFGMMEALVDFLVGWSQNQQQRHWNLWQICLALRSRRPLSEEVDFLSHYSWGRHRRRLRDMVEQLQEGAEPADVFIHPSLLSRLEGAQVATGLKTGRLSQVLIDMQQRRTEFLYHVLQMHNPVVSMLYPWTVVVSIVAVVSFINYYIIPKFRKIFDDFGVELPALTKMMVNASDTFVSAWYLASPLLLLVLAALTVLSVLPLASGHAGVRERLTWIWPRICLPDILRTLAHAVRANVPLEEALSPLVRRQLRIPLHNRLVRVQEAVREGHDCWDELAANGLLRRREADLLQSAQRTGNLAWALETISRRFEQSWRFRLLFCFEWVQPLLILSIGSMVAFFAFACFLPLVKLLVDLS